MQWQQLLLTPPTVLRQMTNNKFALSATALAVERAPDWVLLRSNERAVYVTFIRCAIYM